MCSSDLLTKRKIADKELSLQIHNDARAIAIGKQPLLDLQLSNQISQHEHKDEDLNRRIDLELQRAIVAAENAITELNYQRPILDATREIDNSIASILTEGIAAGELEDLIELYTTRRLELTEILRSVLEDRNNLRSQLGSKNNTSSLITEAINAVDARSAHYDTIISELDRQLHVDLPAERLLIESRVAALERQLSAQEQDLILLKQDQNVKLVALEDALAIAKQEQRVSKLNRKYTQEKLDNETEAIKTAFSGYDASHEAMTLQLESVIADLRVVLDQSIPSEVLTPAEARSENTRANRATIIVVVMFFVAIGFFFVFFFELLDKVKHRIAETN